MVDKISNAIVGRTTMRVIAKPKVVDKSEPKETSTNWDESII